MKEDRTKYFLPIFVGVLAFGEGMNANLFFAMMAGAMLALYMTLRLMQVSAERKDKRQTFVPFGKVKVYVCLLYTSPSPRDATLSRMPSSA